MSARLVGYYNRDGYRIERPDDHGGRILYEAGNNPLESSSHVDQEDGLPLRTIRRFCLQTGREMAAEMDGTFAGAEREEERTEA